jgi:hypothetical protein
VDQAPQRDAAARVNAVIATKKRRDNIITATATAAATTAAAATTTCTHLAMNFMRPSSP